MTGNKIVVVKQVQTDWVIGWKAAMPYIRDSNDLVFMPLVCRDIPYGVNDVAVCRRYGHSRPPADRCKCGFNAWNDIDQAISYALLPPGTMITVAHHGNHKLPVHSANETLAILRVGLHGSVLDCIEPAWGFRAEKQRVGNVFFNSGCALCSADATALGVMNTEYPLSPQQRAVNDTSYLLWSLCNRHHHMARRIVDPTDIATRNNVKIHWGYPTSE